MVARNECVCMCVGGGAIGWCLFTTNYKPKNWGRQMLDLCASCFCAPLSAIL